MKSSNVGGQAVIEGVMMKYENTYAVAVRKPDGEICVKKEETKDGCFAGCKKIPLLRGVFQFVDSLVLGMKTLTYSASFWEEEEEKEQSEKKEQLIMAGTVALSVVLAVAIFMVLPYLITDFLGKLIPSRLIQTTIEGVIRIGIFILYVLLISRMEDIRRVFMYHGAEHKCINCIEHGYDLNVENVRKSSKEHKRCGTSFLFFVLLVSIVVCFFITTPSRILRLVFRILLLPVIAGISYEIIRLAGSSNNFFVNLLSKPGLALQHLTTKEPDDSMIEVAICSVDAVFDWKQYQKEHFTKTREDEEVEHETV